MALCPTALQAREPLTDSLYRSLAATPPMGWNSWNKFGCNVSESLIRDMADAMVASGMADAGYQYVVIDDCWQVSRDEDGNIVPDPERFPSGMKALADYIHSLGLKFGIYSCAGSYTCQGRPGSKGHQFQDALQYARWGVDYLKYDWCSNDGQNAKAAYQTMSEAIKASGRPIVLSICEWGENKPWEWGEGIGHLWRVTPDIRACFDCTFDWGGVGVLQCIDAAADLYPYAGPGHWNDMEMLEVGNGELTYDENVTHFSMWCMMAAPLMSGNDLREMDFKTRQILTNNEVIAVNQDRLGMQGIRFMKMGDHEIWAKPLYGGEIAVCFLNRSDTPWKLDYNWTAQTMYFAREVNLRKNTYTVRDLWQHKDLGRSDKAVTGDIPAHGVKLLRLERTAGHKMASLTNTFSQHEVLKNATGWAYWFVPIDGVGDTLSVKMSYVDKGTGTHDPHAHNPDELFVLLYGNAVVTLNGEEQALQPGDAFFAPSGSFHSIRRAVDRFPIKYVMFKRETTGPVPQPYGFFKKDYKMTDCYVKYEGRDAWYLTPKMTMGGLNARVCHVSDTAVHPWNGADAQAVYFILEGQARVTVDGEQTDIAALSSCYCPAGSKHSIQNTGTGLLKYIEVSTR